MGSGKASGRNREYQELCRDFLVRRSPDLLPYRGDGVDVRVEGLAWTNITFDVLMKDGDGNVVAAESKRWASSAPQGEVFEFAAKCEQLRKKLGVEVAGFIFAKEDVQIGTDRTASFYGFQVVIHPDETNESGFRFRYHRYDKEREARIRDFKEGVNEMAHITESVVHVLRNEETPDDLSGK